MIVLKIPYKLSRHVPARVDREFVMQYFGCNETIARELCNEAYMKNIHWTRYDSPRN